MRYGGHLRQVRHFFVMSLLRTGRSVVKVSLCHGQGEISLDFLSKTYGAYHYTLGGRSEIVDW